MRDFYEVLGVKRGATQDEIKKAYRERARKLHPDANQGDDQAEERFKELSAAYDTLSDPDKRKAYDQFGASGGTAGGGFDPGAFRQYAQAQGFDISDLLGDLLGRNRGGGAGRGRPERGADLETKPISLSFEQSLSGVELTIPVEREAPCGDCGGNGAAPGTSPRVCPDCRGRGVVGRDEGVFSVSVPCSRCAGRGTVVDKACGGCHGSGRVTATKKYRVQVPAGIQDGKTIRLKGKGLDGKNGGPAGDLFVPIRVGSALWERRGDDLSVDVPVTFPEVALGAEIEVPTPTGGRVRVKVPAGSSDGRTLRVRGHGAPLPGKKGAQGDLLVRLRVAVPDSLSRQQREALERYADLDGGADPRAGLFTAAGG